MSGVVLESQKLQSADHLSQARQTFPALNKKFFVFDSCAGQLDYVKWALRLVYTIEHLQSSCLNIMICEFHLSQSFEL